MQRSHLKSLVLAGAVALATAILCGEARAAIVLVNSTVGGLPLPGTNLITFDAPLPAGVGLSFTGNAAIIPGVPTNISAQPFLSGAQGAAFGTVNGPDVTNYITTGTGTATLTFNTPVSSFGLLWGSVDNYNALTFYDAANNVLGTYTGLDVLSGAGGNQGLAGTVYANFVTTGNTVISRVTMTSGANAFEFDNVSFAAVPEPASVVLGLGLFGAMGLVVVRTRKAKASV